jgi:hypothetical protein
LKKSGSGGYAAPTLTPETQKLLDSQASEAGLSADQVADRELVGAKEAGQAANASVDDKLARNEASLGGPQIPGMREALRNISQSRLEKDLGRLDQTTRQNAQASQGKRMGAVANMFLNKQEKESAISKLKVQSMNKRIMARAQMVNSMLKTAGTVVGGAFGGPMGAQAGGSSMNMMPADGGSAGAGGGNTAGGSSAGQGVA